MIVCKDYKLGKSALEGANFDLEITDFFTSEHNKYIFNI